jgi:hypothetical protein
MVTTTTTTPSPNASKAVVRKTRRKSAATSAVTAPPPAKVEKAERPPEPLVFTIPTVDVHLSTRRLVVSPPALPHVSAPSPKEALAGLNRATTDMVRSVAGIPERIWRELVRIASRSRGIAVPPTPDGASPAPADEQSAEPAT